jgi:hypothetical protein
MTRASGQIMQINRPRSRQFAAEELATEEELCG